MVTFLTPSSFKRYAMVLVSKAETELIPTFNLFDHCATLSGGIPINILDLYLKNCFAYIPHKSYLLSLAF